MVLYLPMMNFKPKMFCFCALLGTSIILDAQDANFSQFYNNPIYTNPAYAGSAINAKDDEFATRVGLAYRNQWPGLRGSYQTVNANWDRHFNRLHGGLGGFVLNDVAGSGLLTSTSIGLIYAPTFEINNKITIRGGLQMAYVNRQLNFNRIGNADSVGNTVWQLNEPLPQQGISFINVGAGLIAYMKQVHFGFAVHNINQPNQSFYNSVNGILPRRYTLHAGGKINILKRQSFASAITPAVLFMKQQMFTQLNITTTANFGRILIGTGFRQTFGRFGNSDALIGILGYTSPRYQITYSYDATVSSARPAARESHEITMNYFISLKKNQPKLELISPSYGWRTAIREK